jgi:transposase
MIVIGVDTHKRSHTLVAVDAVTGGVLGERTVLANDEGALAAVRLVAALGDERVWAIEDCRHVSGRFERSLVAAGERVIRIPPALTANSRRSAREPGKSDRIDALAIAHAALREGIERFPPAFLDEQAMEIRLLCDYREQLVVERTRLMQTLRWHLVALDPELEAGLRPAGLVGPRIRARVARRLAKLGNGAQARVAKALLARISQISRQEIALETELTTLVAAHSPQLLRQHGCGTITAAILVGHTAGAANFPTDASFARHTGTAPIPASSGNTTRHRLHRGGDRQLNRALHIIALSRARTDPHTRAYLDRRAAEGKTKREALRCLKRHLARHFWKLLYKPANSEPTLT